MIFLCYNQINKCLSFFRNSIKVSVYSNIIFDFIFHIYTNLLNEKKEYFYDSMEIKNFITIKIADKKNLHIFP